MKFDSFSREQNFLKQHKNYVAGIITLILIAVIIGGLSEFREGREKFSHKLGRSNYERRGEREISKYPKDKNENEKNYKGQKSGDNENENNESTKQSKNITKIEKENKVILPLNIISESDVSKAALASSTGSQTITSASIEDEGGVVAYSFVLDNKSKVNIDAINGKVIANKNEGNDVLEKEESNSASDTGTSK